jgi:hypothetical protein
MRHRVTAAAQAGPIQQLLAMCEVYPLIAQNLSRMHLVQSGCPWGQGSQWPVVFS